MAFCSKCGTEIQQGSSFCPNCGNALAGNPDTTNNIFGAKSSKNKLIGIIACVLVAALLIVGIVTVVNITTAGNYEDVALEYCVARFKGDWKNIDKYLPYNPKDMYEYTLFSDMLDEDFDEADYDEIMDYYDVTAKVARSSEMSEDDIQNMLYDIEYELSDYDFDIDDYIDENKIGKGYFVDVNMEVYEESDDEYWPDETFRFAVVKYKGKWKVLTDFISDEDKFNDVW